MHFIGMLAFLMPVPVHYAFVPTALSLIVAILVAGIGFHVIGTCGARPLQLTLARLFMGLGIVAMHCIGMTAMRMDAELSYDPVLLAASVVIAVGASTAALWMAFRTASVWQRVLAAVLMGAAIAGMHYTATAAASFTGAAAHTEPAVPQTELALAVAGVNFLILMLALVASVFDRQVALLAARETELLRQSEEQFRLHYRDTPLPLHAVGPDGRIATVSDAWLELLGCTQDQIIGRPLSDFMTAAARRDYEQVVWPRLLQRGEVRDVEYQFVRRSGEILDVLLSARPMVQEGRFVRSLGGLIDVTARKRAEGALQQAQRMKAMGQLTGGVAHDFNNLLMVISGAAENLRRRIGGPEQQRPLEMIVTAVKRGQTLTSQFLSFARRRTLETTVIELAEWLPGLSEILRRSLRGDIEIRTSIAAEPCRIRVDPGELALALLNLGVNARDAMPDGGILSLAVRRAQLAGAAEVDHLRGDFVLIELKDTGSGIPADVLPRAFDPFFTTKEPGKGTGLGLSQVYGFAKQSGGTATIRSQVGRGTTVSICLPATTEPATHVAAHADAMAGERVSAGTVLLVEDNPDVAAVSADFIGQFGYQVDLSHNGAEALQNLQRRSYELVFSDILMPGSVGGLELARIVRDYHAEIPVLLTTGYSDKAQQAVNEGFAIVPKPFDLPALAQAIRETAGRHNPRPLPHSEVA